MRSVTLTMIAALVLAVTAAAKGPSSATISGPGLDDEITIGGLADEGGFAQQAGFFAQAFGQTPDPTLRTRPAGVLGPRYDVDYTVPGPDGEVWHLKAALYPYAEGGPLSYMRPGQPFFRGPRSHGGWFRAPAELRAALVEAGLPPARVRAGGATPFWRSPGGIALWVAVAMTLFAATLLIRRRPRPAAA